MSAAKTIVLWNLSVPSPKLAAAFKKRDLQGQHVLHTIKGAYVLSKDGDWKCVRGATNIADLIRATCKKRLSKKVGAKRKQVTPTTKKVKTTVVKRKKVAT